MRRIWKKYLPMATLLIAVLGPGSGCKKERLMAIDDHPKLQASLIESVSSNAIWFFEFLPQYTFWHCVESSSKMTCTPQCKSGEIHCPKMKLGK